MKSRRLIGIFLALVLCSTHVAWAVDERPLRALTLEQALAELDSQSPTLVQVRSRVADARALATQARVPLIPTVVASGGYTRNSADARVDFAGTPLASLHPGALVIQPLGVWTVAGTVRVPLIIPNAWADWSAAQRAADAVAATAESARLQLRASLAQSAWAAAAAEEIVAVSERAVAVAEEHQRSAARGVTAGTEAPLSVLKAETEVVKRQSDLAQARANRERSHLALGVLLGKTDPVRVLLPPEPGSEAARDVESLVAEALQSRPEIAAQVAQIRAAQSQATAARLGRAAGGSRQRHGFRRGRTVSHGKEGGLAPDPGCAVAAVRRRASLRQTRSGGSSPGHGAGCGRIAAARHRPGGAGHAPRCLGGKRAPAPG